MTTDLPRRKMPKLNNEMRLLIERTLQEDDEVTGRKLKNELVKKWTEVSHVSLSTIKREKRKLGWVCTRPRYCQLLQGVSSV